MALKDNLASPGGLVGAVFRTAMRTLQFVMALVVLGLYGTDLEAFRKAEQPADSRWIYAETIAGLAALTSLVYMIPMVKAHVAFAWDALLFLLWVVVFGIFGKLLIGKDTKKDAHAQRMLNAVWVDLFNMCLWFITAAYGAIIYMRRRASSARSAV
ncbi:MAG: hypothetical protein M1832_000645 [Thelocarpon impressellum]|nr:MAG: hypothetical protein M1832_000645 [Thelocarpon impressellum]